LTVIEVRNLNSEDWPKDLEIEVKNNSNKPIYHITIMMTWQNPPRVLGEGWGLNLRYGDSQLISSRKAGPADESIRPGERYVFTVAKNKCKECGVPRVEGVSRILLNLSVVAFGDKTGYKGGRAYKVDEK
jgi:hypothetical protein